jgi:hypothetical protein
MRRQSVAAICQGGAYALPGPQEVSTQRQPVKRARRKREPKDG